MNKCKHCSRPIVFLLDVDNTLLDNDGVQADLRRHLIGNVGRKRAKKYQTRKWIGAFAAALGGLHTLVFTGGVGKNAPGVRARICEGLGFLGIELDQQQNAQNAEMISCSASHVAVRVIHTDEELMIAKSVFGFF